MSIKDKSFLDYLDERVKESPTPLNENLEVANTIYQQLGGGQFAVITGSRNFTGGSDHLSFRFPRNGGVNHLKITLNGKDLYDLEFGLIHGNNFKVKNTFNDIYVDQLRDIFTDVTGLYTSF